MTGRKSTKKKAAVARQHQGQQQTQQQQYQARQQQQQQAEETVGSPPPPNNIRKEQPPPPQIVKKIAKTENDEADTLKTVFKSDPNTQMKDFIKKAVVKPTQQVAAMKQVAKTPADSHPPAIAQQLLDTDDDVADNLAKLFKSSKSYKNS